MSARVLTALAVAFAVVGAVLLAWNPSETERGTRVSVPDRSASVAAVPEQAGTAGSVVGSTPGTGSSSAPVVPSPAPSRSVGPGEGDDIEVPVPSVAPAPEDVSVAAAARRVVQAYARPAQGVTQQQWWAGVAPLLSPQARSDYLYVQGAKVPFTKVIAAPLVEPPADGEDSHLGATVLVPTDGGTYEVQLVTVDGANWLVSRLGAVEGTE